MECVHTSRDNGYGRWWLRSLLTSKAIGFTHALLGFTLDWIWSTRRSLISLRWLWISSSLLVVSTAATAENEDILLAAMSDELDRSMTELQLDESPPPYFVSYTVREFDGISTTASLGSVEAQQRSHRRVVFVDVRVGDYERDNSNWMSRGGTRTPFTALDYSAPLPVDDDYDEIRRELWRATDEAYKSALHDLSGKKTALENRTLLRDAPDFSREEPLQYENVEEFDLPDEAEIAQIAAHLSRAFVGHSFIQISKVTLEAMIVKRTFINSEGTLVRTSSQSCFLTVLAHAQADNGREFVDFEYAHAEDCVERGSVAMEVQVASLIQRLQEQLAAEELATYDGPVLFEGQAAAELLHDRLVPRLRALRAVLTERVGNDFMSRSEFLDKLGARVLTRSLSVVNDPTIKEHEGVPLAGSYEVDAEGVRARPVSLIERGVLRSMLTTRTPVDDFLKSTGSKPPGGVIRASNVFFVPHGGIPVDKLRSELLLLAEERGLEYGIVVRRLGSNAVLSSSDITGRSHPTFFYLSTRNRMLVLQAYKLYADGREVPIVGVSMANFSTRMFRDILEVSDAVERHDVFGWSYYLRIPFANDSRLATPPLVSMIVPSLLFEDITLKRTSESYPQRPFVPHPSSQD